jgi:hypothetical protein
VQATDILNTYLTSPCDEKVWTILGPEFGPELERKRAIIVRSLYGLKSSGEAYRYHIATYVQHLGFTDYKADPEVWIRENNDHTGAEFYESVRIYSDEILANGKDPSAILSRLNTFKLKEGKYFTLKKSSVGPSDQYIGAKSQSSIGVNGKKFWIQSSSGYEKQ